MKNILPILLLAFLTSCASVPKGDVFTQTVSEDPSKARVYIYRVKGFAGAAWSHTYWINKQNVAELSTHSYTYILVEPGVHRIHYGDNADYDKLLVEIKLEAGQDYFLREARNSKPPESAIVESQSESAGVNSFSGGIPLSVNWSDTFALVTREFAIDEMTDGYRYQAALVKSFPE